MSDPLYQYCMLALQLATLHAEGVEDEEEAEGLRSQMEELAETNFTVGQDEFAHALLNAAISYAEENFVI